MESIVENATSIIVPEMNPYTSEEIWNAYGALPQSGVFPNLSITNSPEAVKFVLNNCSNLSAKNISIAGSLVEPLHWLEQVSLFNSYTLIIKTLIQPFRFKFFMKNLRLKSSSNVDIIVLIEFFTSPADIHFYNAIEVANPGFNIEYWVADPSVKKDIEKFTKNYENKHLFKILKNKHSILNLCKREKSIHLFSLKMFNNCEIFRRIGYIASKIWWRQITSFANSISGGFIRLFTSRRPKVLILNDDTKLYGSLAAKVARNLKIPTILVPHAIPTPFYFPLICDYQTVWGKTWVNLLKKNELSEKRIWTTGDFTPKPKIISQKKIEEMKNDLGICGKKIIGYFASPAEENNSGVFATISAVSKMENSIVIVRGHPRHTDHAKSLEKKLKNTPAIFISTDQLKFEEFCCLCNVVTTFESTALLYAIRYNNFGFQVNVNNRRQPENNYKELMNLHIAHNENEIIEILNNFSFEDRHLNLTNSCMKNGEDAAKNLFEHIKELLKDRT